MAVDEAGIRAVGSCKTAIYRRPYMADNTELVVIMILRTWIEDKHELTGTALVSYSLTDPYQLSYITLPFQTPSRSQPRVPSYAACA